MQPTLRTERLLLRPFSLTDAPLVQYFAGEREVASPTLNIPHPYESGMAEAWINTHQADFESGKSATFAIVLADSGQLVGAIGLSFSGAHERAEIGYWIGRPYWGKGYATEASAACLAYAFEERHVNRVFAAHMTRNPASGRVMQKLGMRFEGRFRQHISRWGQFEDLDFYAILREEYAEGGKA
jgi:ribosomal-protein-alanine N-acetyltransferase